MYDKKELHPSLIHSYEYCRFFLEKNFSNPIILGPRIKGEVIKGELKLKESDRDHKIKLFNHLIKNVKLYNGKIYFPDNVEDVSYSIKESIDFFDK
jgi:hypothetical protein